MKVRYIFLAIGLAFAVTLAVIVGQRISAEAMAVVVGVVAGVAASIPTSLIVVWVTTRSLTPRPVPESERRPAAPQPAPEPRIVVLTQPAPQPQPALPPHYQYMAAPYLSAQPSYPLEPRRFTVIGGEATDPPILPAMLVPSGRAGEEADEPTDTDSATPFPTEVIWQR